MNDPYAKPDQVLQSQLNKSRKDKFLLVLNLPPALKNIQQQNYMNHILI